jgi:hypothetical protein
VVEKGGDEGEERGGLDRGAIGGFQEIEEEVHVDFAGEEGAGWRMEEKHALQEVEGGDNEEVIRAIGTAAEEVFKTRY